MVELLTVGHGTAAATELGTALAAAQVRALVDIRIAPGSRRSPHLARDRLSEWLPAYGVDYRWDRRLGGFRKLPSDSPDIALRNTSFRAYAAWMRDCEFATVIDELQAGAAGTRTAVLQRDRVVALSPPAGRRLRHDCSGRHRAALARRPAAAAPGDRRRAARPSDRPADLRRGRPVHALTASHSDDGQSARMPQIAGESEAPAHNDLSLCASTRARIRSLATDTASSSASVRAPGWCRSVGVDRPWALAVCRQQSEGTALLRAYGPEVTLV